MEILVLVTYECLQVIYELVCVCLLDFTKHSTIIYLWR